MNPRQYRALERARRFALERKTPRERDLTGRGRISPESLLFLVKAGFLRCTTLNHPDSFDNAYYNHAYELTAAGCDFVCNGSPRAGEPKPGVVCLYCGCSTFRACTLAGGATCQWVRVFAKASNPELPSGLGVCSNPRCVNSYVAGGGVAP